MNTLRYGMIPFALLSVICSQALAQDSALPPDTTSPSIVTTPEDGSTPPAATTPADAPLASAPATSATTAATAVFDNRFYLAPMASYALSSNSRHASDAFGGGIALGKSIVPHLAIELVGDFLYYKGQTLQPADTGLSLCVLTPNNPACNATKVSNRKIYGGGLGANAYLSPTNHGLFAHADAQEGNRFVYNGGFGIDLPILNHDLALRAEALYHKENGFKAEPLFHLGLRIPFGALPVPAAQPEPPVALVPTVEPPPPSPPPPCEMPAAGEPISLDGCKSGDTIVLRGVNFDFNKSTLTLNAKAILDQVSIALASRPDIIVEVDGHTDGKGSVPYNQKLSERRAKSVEAYLIDKGLDASRITAKGFGKSMPIADNSTDEGRELNRRVELKVVNTKTADGGTDVPVSSGATESVTPPAAPANPAPTADTAATPLPQ